MHNKQHQNMNTRVNTCNTQRQESVQLPFVAMATPPRPFYGIANAKAVPLRPTAKAHVTKAMPTRKRDREEPTDLRASSHPQKKKKVWAHRNDDFLFFEFRTI